MTIEPTIILEEKGLKDAFDKKCKMLDMGYTFMSCQADLVLSTTSAVGLQLIKVFCFSKRKWENQLPIGCLSTPANVVWQCPAVYLDNSFIAIPKKKELSICKWELNGKFNDPIIKMSLKVAPLRIWNFLNSGVLIGYGNGQVEVMDGEFKVLLEIDSQSDLQEILFMDCLNSGNDVKLVIVGISKEKLELHVSLYGFEKQQELPVLVSNVSFDILGYKNFKNLAFSYDDETLNVTTYNIRSNSIEKVSHDISLKSKESKVLSFKLISNNHVAVLNAVNFGGKVLPQVTIWDNRYGTLQSTIDIDMVTLPDKLNRSQGCLNGFYDASGYFLTISLSSMSSNMVNTTHLLLPVKMEPISLKSVLGKLANKSDTTYSLATLETGEVPKLSQSCLDLNELNRDMLSKLLDQQETDKFEGVFKEWVYSNLKLLSKENKNYKKFQGKNWVDASAFLVSQSQIKSIAVACFDKESSIWPRNVIKYCLKNQLFYSSITNSSLVERIISKNDCDLLWIAIHYLLDISESDWSGTIKYILGLSDTSEIDKLASNDGNLEMGKSPIDANMSSGQDYICSMAFSSPKNHHLMARALAKLETNDLEKLVNWICQIIIMKDERFMWWAWGAIGTNLSQEKVDILFERRQMAINALSLLVDSNLVLMSTAPKLLEILQEIRLHINQECSFVSYFQRRVFGMLKQFKKHNPNSLGQKKPGGRRWHRMVHDIQDNTGSYCVEVLKL